MSSPISSPPTSRTLRSLSSCHGGFETPTCVLLDTLTRFGSLRSGWSLIALPFRVCLFCCCSIHTRRAIRLPTHIRSRPSLEKPLKEIRNIQLDFYAEISKPAGLHCPGPSSSPYSPKCMEGVFSEVRLNGVLRSSHSSLRTPLLSLPATSRRAW